MPQNKKKALNLTESFDRFFIAAHIPTIQLLSESMFCFRKKHDIKKRKPMKFPLRSCIFALLIVFSCSSCIGRYNGRTNTNDQKNNEKAEQVFKKGTVTNILFNDLRPEKIITGSTVEFEILLRVLYDKKYYLFRLKKDNQLVWMKEDYQNNDQQFIPYTGYDQPVYWSKFNITVTGGRQTGNGQIKTGGLSECPDGKMSINVSYSEKKELRMTGDINLFDNKKATLDFNGSNGENGEQGHNGLAGSSRNGCTPGDSGANGYSGSNGLSGEDIMVYLKKVQHKQSQKTLLAILVCNASTGDSSRFFINPENSRLVITATGGKGGNGGKGGKGGDGGTRSEGSKTYGCQGGNGGHGGNGGDGGNGGTIHVTVDEGLEMSSLPVSFKNEGGGAGYAGGGGAGGEAGKSIRSRFIYIPPSLFGRAGLHGEPGAPGPPPVIVSKPLSNSLFRF